MSRAARAVGRGAARVALATSIVAVSARVVPARAEDEKATDASSASASASASSSASASASATASTSSSASASASASASSPLAPSSSSPAPAPPAPPAPVEKERFFYHRYDYGSESTYNPASVLVNRGWDMMQLGDDRRDPWHFDYATNAANVLDNLAHAPSRVGEEGWSKFLREEIFPLSWTPTTARWLPNYTLHLIGGGQTFAMLDEWFDEHGVPLPWAFSALTLMTAALVNESIENDGVRGRNTDCIADMWVFDLGGIALFSFPAVRRFFGRELVLMDWSPPPAFTWPNGELHNHGNYYAARWALPFWKPLSLFSYFGAWTTFGLSWRFDGERSVSLSVGEASTKLIGRSTNLVDNVVSWAPAAGLFLDRNGSLLASLKIANVPDYFVHLELFPGLLRKVPWLGAFTAVAKNGHFVAGLTTTLGFGAGVRVGSMQP